MLVFLATIGTMLSIIGLCVLMINLTQMVDDLLQDQAEHGDSVESGEDHDSGIV